MNITLVFSLDCSGLQEAGLELPLDGRELIGLFFPPALNSCKHLIIYNIVYYNIQYSILYKFSGKFLAELKRREYHIPLTLGHII